MSRVHLAAHTETTPGHYPAYFSVVEDGGIVSIHTRTRGEPYASVMHVTKEAWERIKHQIAAGSSAATPIL